jgi:hypothetical protein
MPTRAALLHLLYVLTLLPTQQHAAPSQGLVGI